VINLEAAIADLVVVVGMVVVVVVVGPVRGVHVEDPLLEAGPHLGVDHQCAGDPVRDLVDLLVGVLRHEVGDPGPDLVDPHLVVVPHHVADHHLEMGPRVDIRKEQLASDVKFVCSAEQSTLVRIEHIGVILIGR